MNKISIVMPVYNSERFLRQCLDSLVNQTFKDFKLICIDDGSTDNSYNILSEYKQKYDNLVEIIKQENQGSGAARNNGFGFVNSETVIFLDSDDYFYPDFLEKMYKKYQETNADIVICKYNVKIPNGKVIQSSTGICTDMLPNNEIFNKNDIPKYIFNFVNRAAWNKLIKCDLIKKYNIKFDTIPNNEDILFTLSSLLYADKIAIANETLLDYNFMNENSVTLGQNENLGNYIFGSFNYLSKQIEGNSDLEVSLYNAYLTTIMYTLNFLNGKNRENFLKLIKNNVPLRKKTDFHKKYLYYRLILIKCLPISGYVILCKIKFIIKYLIGN